MAIRLIGINDSGLWIVTSLVADEGTLSISYTLDNEINLDVIGAALLAITQGMLAGSIPASKLIMTDLVLTESQITNLTTDLNSLQSQINTKISGNQTITISGDASGSGTTSITLTLGNVGTAGTYDGSVTTDAKGRVTAGTNISESSATRTIQTTAAAANGWQISASRASLASYSILIACGINERGDVVIEVNPANTAVAAAWVEKGRIAYGQSGGLAEPTQSAGFQISALVPVGSYVRIRSINTTGSPAFTYLSGQEDLL